MTRKAPPSATDPDLIYADDGVVIYSPTQAMEDLQQRFTAGDRTALLAALYIFTGDHRDIEGRERLLPEWVRDGFQSIYRDVLFGVEKGWDSAFGHPHPKGRNVSSYRNRIKFAGRIFRAVVAARERGEPVNRDLFEKVGESLGVSGSTAERYYYDISGGRADDE